MPFPLALIALLLASPHPARGVYADRVSRIGGWTLDIAGYPFAGGQGCRLYRRGIHYERSALVFHLPPRTDTAAAVYRIDGGPPRAARDDQAALARLGFLLENDALDNPSGGLVRVPEALLAGAAEIRIAAWPGARPVAFDLAGFAAARALADRAGCTAEAFGDPGPALLRRRRSPATRHRLVAEVESSSH